MSFTRAHEAKQQGVLAAARNPNSPVTSDDAERAIVEDARSAGGAAYTFDPLASPAEKAAQARAVGLPLAHLDPADC